MHLSWSASIRVLACVLVCLVAVASVQAQTPKEPPKEPAKPKTDTKSAKASAAFFDEGMIPEIRIEINAEELKKLRANNRAYVKCTLNETFTVKDGKKETAKYVDVGIKLKGAAGSFRGPDDRPALTVNMDKFKDDQSFHGVDKFHLNNSVQDGTLLHELISGHLSLKAGVPAARTTHARVWLNNRDLGIYVLKEGFDQEFLRRHFADATGNLYDGGFCREIDQALDKRSGTGVNNHADLKALRAACGIADLAKRKTELEKVLDIDRFLSFIAVELMTCHWDGYCRNRNNYRIYFNPTDGKAQFFPHGMDQMFSDPNFSLFDAGALVSSAVLQVPDFRQRYRKRLEELLPHYDPEKLHPIVDGVSTRLKPVLEAMNKDQARGYLNNMQGVKGQLTRRYQSLQRMLLPKVEPLAPKFNEKGELLLTGWTAMKDTEDTTLEQQTLPDGKKVYVIKVGPSKQCIASWRREMILPKGKYEFQSLIKTVGVVSNADQPIGTGARIRLSGGMRTTKVEGNTDWKQQTHTIEITEAEQTIVFVAELRATAGVAMFDVSSMKLVRKK